MPRWLWGAVGVLALLGAGAAGLRAASPVVNSTVAIVDANTPVQQAAVSASGALSVSVTTGVSSVTIPGTVAVAGEVRVTNPLTVGINNTPNVTVVNTTVPVGGVAGAANVGVVLSPGSTGPIACSGNITSSSAQILLANSATRQGFQIMNLLNNSNNMGINFESASPTIGVAGTYTLRPGDSYTTPAGFHPQNNIYIIGTQNDKFSCDAW